MHDCQCPCHLSPYAECPAIKVDALSTFLTQTEAMLTIQRAKAERARQLVLEHDRRPAVHDRRVAEHEGLVSEITLLDNVASQLRAAGVIPK